MAFFPLLCDKTSALAANGTDRSRGTTMAKKDLGDYLIERRIIGPEQLAEAEAIAKNNGGKVHEVLVKQGYATSEQVMQAMADMHGYEFFDLRDVPIPPSVVELVPESVARENAVIPLAEEDGALKVLVSDPFDLRNVRKAAVHSQSQGEYRARHARKHSRGHQPQLRPDGRRIGRLDAAGVHRYGDRLHRDGRRRRRAASEDVDETSAPIVRLVQLMIGEAVQLRASDIHVEPFEDRVRIRYRIDGVLVERDSPPRRLLGALLSRIKILAKMDIAERRRCQDGRIKITAGGKELDLRVSMLPTNHGQSCVMRLLDKDNIKVGVRQLGLSEKDFKKFRNLIRRPNGIILVTGPDGLGKDHHPLRRPKRAKPPRPQDHHGRGPGRVLPAGHQPGGGEAQHRARLCPDHPGHVAAGTEHHPGRRDARL